MRFACHFVTVLAALAIAVAASDEVAFTYRDGLIWVRVSAEGAARPLNFVVDTGSSATVIDLGTARQLGLPLGRATTVRGVHGSSAAYPVKGFRARFLGEPLRPSLLALDLSGVGVTCHHPIDGLIGADFFRGQVVSIDFARGRMRRWEEVVASDHSEVLPITFRNECMCVPVEIAGEKKQWMRVDTGCEEALQWAPNQARIGRSGAASIALAGNSVRYVSAAIRLGNRELDAIRTGLHPHPIFPNEDGLLGNGLLSKFRVTLDGRRQRLILDPR